MPTEVAGVKLLPVAYARSARGASYFTIIIGSTQSGAVPYVTMFEDEYGAVGTVEIPRPGLCSYLYNLLLLIGEHNRQRQHFLDKAGAWPTKDPWFRLPGETVGICVVNFFKLARFTFPNKSGSMRIVKFADFLSAGLVVRKRESATVTPGDCAKLTHLTDADNNRRTKKRKVHADGPSPGSLHAQRACWQCRRYYQKCVLTTQQCPYCKVPLCGLDRPKMDPNRHCICYAEHLMDVYPSTKCQDPAPTHYTPPSPVVRAHKAPWPK